MNTIPEKPYAWAVSGCHSLYRGEFAEYDARSEAEHCGGTCKAFPLYKAQTTDPVSEVPTWSDFP